MGFPLVGVRTQIKRARMIAEREARRKELRADG